MSDNQKKNPMTKKAAAEIQSATAKSGGDTGKGSWPARAQSAAAKNENAQKAAQENQGDQQDKGSSTKD
ncbi:hypothetical protein F4810DRAFT_708582 [Camillea tinctor]|nr:hypothetical protein F4810DRAFT_708582 [Camillea tinctor]